MFDRANENSIEPKRVVFLSVEGTKTEVSYFKFVERYKEQLGISAIVHVEVLRKNDTKSDPENVLELLEEYIKLRASKQFEEEIKKLKLKDYDFPFIKRYLDEPHNIPDKERIKFEADLKEEQLDLRYLHFLSKYHGDNDAFGIVIDRDCGSHSIEQMNKVITECRDKDYHCYISNPCIEFWQLLHVSDVIKEYSDQLVAIQENSLDGKGNSFVSNLLYKKTGQRKAIQSKTFIKFYLSNTDLAIKRAKDFAPADQLVDHIGSNLGDLFCLLRS